MSPMGTRASTAWSLEEDQRLMAERRRSQGWGQIQQRWFPTKSPNACRKRHERLMSRKAADEWEGEKFEMLAHTYWTFRRQMWDSVANQIGAPWEVVEQTCLEKGLSSIRTAANNYDKRREQLRQQQREQQQQLQQLHHASSSPHVPSPGSVPARNQLSVPQNLPGTLPAGDLLDSGIDMSVLGGEDIYDAAAALTQTHPSSHPHYHPHPR